MNILKTNKMSKIKYSNLLNKEGKNKYWGRYILIKRFSLDKRISANLTFEQFCQTFASTFKLSELNHNVYE